MLPTSRRAVEVPLLKLQIEEALRLAERSVDGLVQVLARPGLRFATLVDADKPSARSTRDNLSKLTGHGSPPACNGAHNRHTRCHGDQVLSGLRGVY